ncbi:MAG: DUF1016 N-terminal domain-containing protein [Candidatus Ancaeobacter aquaticus]|nr:DUF1016 N-terminal domain-containing protein [Candidatus Ancaeobacter aquaticus]
MTTSLVSEAPYSKLLKQLKKEIAEGIVRAQKAYDTEKIAAYWNIGKSISDHLTKNKHRADYGKKLYKSLSRDLSVGERLLYQMSQFYNTYPDFKLSENLKWSHYRLLSSVKDKEKRDLIESKVSTDNLSNRALETFLKENKEEEIPPIKFSGKKKKKLSVSKGRLYTYKIFKDVYTDNFLIDCGFNIYKESDTTNFKGNFAQSVKTKNNYKFVAATTNRRHLYTYKAQIKKIVDGDTIWVNIDCGFKIWVKQKIRLRGIDTPAIETKKGIDASKFVSKTLKDLPFVIIKSHGRDKYGRYLTDIFYSKNEDNPLIVLEKGMFLNQVLLDEGLAKRLC